MNEIIVGEFRRTPEDMKVMATLLAQFIREGVTVVVTWSKEETRCEVKLTGGY